MERKRYLELCQENAFYGKNNIVVVEGVKFYPVAYKLWFDKEAKNRHTAVLISVERNWILECDLKKVEENEK